MGIVLQRRKKQRAARLRRRLMLVFFMAALSALAMAPALRERLDTAAQTFGQSAQAETTLARRELYALQLGVFDSGERAAQEAERLQRDGVLCMIWQREKMRIVSDVALSRDALSADAAGGQEAYVIRETLEEVPLRLSCGAEKLDQAQALLQAPDDVLVHLLTTQQTLQSIIAQTAELAQAAEKVHPDNALFTQLAQNLQRWCTLMDTVLSKEGEQRARSYAAVTICALCAELRAALSGQAESAASTASAQRTPSTAAEVMPPA